MLIVSRGAKPSSTQRVYDMQLSEPLDFYGVTDHAMFMGVAAEAADTSSDFSRYPFTEVPYWRG